MDKILAMLEERLKNKKSHISRKPKLDSSSEELSGSTNSIPNSIVRKRLDTFNESRNRKWKNRNEIQGEFKKINHLIFYDEMRIEEEEKAWFIGISIFKYIITLVA